MKVGSTLSKGVGISKEIMVYQKIDTRLPKKTQQKRVTEEALTTRETRLLEKTRQKMIAEEAPVTKETRLLEKARQKRVIEEAPITK